MESSTTYHNISGARNDDIIEKCFRTILTKEISEDDLETIPLKYIPDYIREIRNKKNYWKKEYRLYEDVISLKNWRSFQKKFKDEINKHKTILKNLDGMWQRFVDENDSNYFSRSVDPEHVQNMVDHLKENHNNYNIVYELTGFQTEYPTETLLLANVLGFTSQWIEKLFYVVYAIWALYGEFRVRPPGYLFKINYKTPTVLDTSTIQSDGEEFFDAE